MFQKHQRASLALWHRGVLFVAIVVEIFFPFWTAPWNIDILNSKMEVWFGWVSFSIGWFVGFQPLPYSQNAWHSPQNERWVKGPYQPIHRGNVPCMFQIPRQKSNIKIPPANWTWNPTLKVWKLIFLFQRDVSTGFQPLICGGCTNKFPYFIYHYAPIPSASGFGVGFGYLNTF